MSDGWRPAPGPDEGEHLLARLVVPRRTALAGGVLAALAAGGLAVSGRVEAAYGGPTRSGSARSAVDPRSVSWVSTRRRAVALTFDDGPDPATTPLVLDLLAEHRARATFFVVGRSIDEHPDIVARIVAEGHTLANHTYDHAPLEQLDQAAVRVEIERGRAAIAPYERGPRYLRPPRGYTNDTVTRVAAALGERQVFWSRCLESTPGDTDTGRGHALAETAGGGDVVLLHDGGHTSGHWAQTYDRMPSVRGLAGLLEGLASAAIGTLTLPELLGDRPA